MKIEIRVPAMGESISEATVAALIKSTGTIVKIEEELIELETDKVNQVLYAPEDGVISWIVKRQENVKIGQLLGTLETEISASPSEKTKSNKNEEAPTKAKAQVKSETAASTPIQPITPDLVSSQPGIAASAPIAKKELVNPKESLKPAHETPISIESVPQPLASPPTEKKESRKKMSKIRTLISSRMVQVQQQMAMLTTFNEVDMEQIISMREVYKEAFLKKHNVRLGYMPFFIKAVVSALKAFPQMHAYIDGEELVTRHYFDISVAVGTEKGVVTPVIRNCEQLSFAEIEMLLESLAKKAREGGLNPSDLQGGGFTITNGGVYGSLLSTPIINPPQCAILGMHKINKRPVVIDDQIAIRQMMYLALSYDHRIVDGQEAVSFLVHIKNILEEPARLLFEL